METGIRERAHVIGMRLRQYLPAQIAAERAANIAGALDGCDTVDECMEMLLGNLHGARAEFYGAKLSITEATIAGEEVLRDLKTLGFEGPWEAL